MTEKTEDPVKTGILPGNMQPKSLAIRDWAEDDRPREKLLYHGAQTLSNAELLAIIIGSGWGKRTAIDLANEVLEEAGRSWQDIGRMGVKKMMTIKGIGLAKAITINAAFEIGRRRQAATIQSKPVIRTSQDAAGILQPFLADRRHEVFCILYLNHANRLERMEVISEGGICGTVVDPRIVFKKALDHAASSLLLCHNHPSGNLKPSAADLELTQKLKEAGKLFDIMVLDHLIVSDQGYFSFADQGLM